MTAMSDVTVLLLTFFMLTSTFLQKEPTIVYTPSSVSEEKVPTNNLVTVLISSADKSGKLPDPTQVEGKIFISFTGDADSTFSSEKIRGMMLDEALAIYNDQHKNAPVRLTTVQRAEFTKINQFYPNTSRCQSLTATNSKATWPKPKSVFLSTATKTAKVASMNSKFG